MKALKQILIISGKGGTGKTVISGALANIVSNKVMADCDVDAANLYLLLKPEIMESVPFYGEKKATVKEESCTGCGLCLPRCRFSAIAPTPEGKIKIDPIACEGCGVCAYICPVKAIEMEENIAGHLFVSRTAYGPFVHARLGAGEENSGKLVTEVRKKAREIAEKEGLDYVIIDGPPGIGCPVVASLSGVDLALVVTEPTMSGIYDMDRVIQTARHFGLKTACVLNKFDLNSELSQEIENWCRSNSVPVLARIPFEEKVVRAVIQGLPITEFSEARQSQAVAEIHKLWLKIADAL
jgi:MinD superfamily P-loop ATPase